MNLLMLANFEESIVSKEKRSVIESETKTNSSACGCTGLPVLDSQFTVDQTDKGRVAR